MKLQYREYHTKIDRIIDYLEGKDTIPDSTIAKLQNALDNLAKQYEDDEDLGAERYKMAHAQSLIYLRQQEDDKAAKWKREAVAIRGLDSQKAKDALLDHQPPQEINNEDTPAATEQKNDPRKEDKSNGWGTRAISILLTLIFIGVGKALGLGALVLIIPALLGLYLGNKFSHKLNPRFLLFMAFSNLIAWLVPIIGLFVAMFSYSFYGDKRLKDWKASIECLMTVGIIVSLSNGIFGAINKTRNRLASADFDTVIVHILWLSVAILLGWLALRIHMTDRKRSIFKRIGLWVASGFVVVVSIGMSGAVIDAYVSNHTSDKVSASSMSPDEYWQSFKQGCSEEILKNPDLTSDDAETYCGCMTDELSAQFSPAEVEQQADDASSTVSAAIEQERSTCGDRAGLIFE